VGSRVRLDCNLQYAAGLMRALLGAMIFALPLTMTMEMWELGVTIEPARLVILLVAAFPMLVVLSYYAGFEKTFSLLDNVLDVFAAIAVSAIACLAMLFLFGAIAVDTPPNEIAGKLSVLSFGASIGALLADKQFNDEVSREDASEMSRGFAATLFVMSIGAIFLSLNIAPTEEVQLIAVTISPALATTLATLSLLALGIILSFADPATARSSWVCKVRRALAGYGVCLILSAIILWCFGRLDGIGLAEAVETVVVLGFPAALGAGAAKLIFGGDEDDAEA
jgi:putative integral membrane protein (TIGR02587 family)